MSRKKRQITQQKQLQKKFDKQAASGKKPNKKDKYVHFKGKHAINTPANE